MAKSISKQTRVLRLLVFVIMKHSFLNIFLLRGTNKESCNCIRILTVNYNTSGYGQNGALGSKKLN